jgi:hypothetical protein
MSRSYRVVISLEIEAENEDAAMREAMSIVTDDTMVIEAITEIKAAVFRCNQSNQTANQTESTQ